MTKTLLTALALTAGITAANAYENAKYDSRFGMSVEGAYGIATKNIDPNVAGGNLSLFNYVEQGSIVHQFSLNAGILSGSHHPGAQDLGFVVEGATLKTTYIPLMAGYTLNMPIGDVTMFYVGGKAGATSMTTRLKTTVGSAKSDDFKFSWAVQAGFKFSVSESADIVLGYEYFQIQGLNNPGYHTIKLGVAWDF